MRAVGIHGLNPRRVILVDPYSSGRLLGSACKRRKLSVMTLQSSREVPQGYGGFAGGVFFRPEATVIYDGRYSQLLEHVKTLHPSAIIASAESDGIQLADRLSEDLGLPGNGTHLSEARRDKFLMGEVLERAGIRHARQALASTGKELRRFLDVWDEWPVVLKPRRDAGTKDCFIVDNRKAAIEAFQSIRGVKTFEGKENDSALLMQYLSGVEYAVNTVSSRGKHLVTDIWQYERHRVAGAATVYDHDLLLPYEGDVQEVLRTYSFHVLDAFGIAYGPAHLEIKMVSEGPTLIEIGARLCGAMLPRLVERATGQSQIDRTVSAHLFPDEFADLPPGYMLQQSAAMFFFQSPEEGRVMSWTQIPTIKNLAGVVSVTPLFVPGVSLKRTIDSDSVIGQVELLHDDPQVIQDTIGRIREIEAQDLIATFPR